ncbi:hypothetical protein [Glycomyces harbinensis]|uniref:Uncharacterized protein n=1 Tax=Glycomyces harbinensis TaxID=58114 RepID=A0A1G6SDU6_9ACTN|nr:hypothetical protein [Glycomyces harbinensis]SDD14317.1 hypothetical protein SAMN05216270_1028 [Glycomyces harbinensis]
MDQDDFYDLTDAVIERLLPRMPQRFLNIYEGMQVSGEYWRLVEGLVWVLVDDQIPVSAQEREQLSKMVDHLKDNEEMRAKLSGLTLESGNR